MKPLKECPKCGEDISESYEDDDPSVGIYGGWYCEPCDLALPNEEFNSDESDWL